MKLYQRDHLAAIGEAISSLNAQYGRGRVKTLGLALDGQGWFTYTVPLTHYTQTKPFKRKFTIMRRGNRVTVYALGHQKTVNL